MNPYQNKNEYEIFNAPSNGFSKSNNYSRYPLANKPNQPLKNTNYKDWLNVCQDNQQYGNNAGNFVSSETIVGVSAGIIVVGTMLGAFAAPVLAAGIISFGTLLPIFWQGSDPANVWQNLLNIGGRPIQEIDKNIINVLTSIVTPIKNQLDKYQEFFDKWEPARTHANAKAVHDLFTTLEPIIDKDLDMLKNNASYRIPTLPAYAQIATWHLNLLKHAATYYNIWLQNQGINPSTFNSSNYYQGYLKRKIQEYTDYCIQTYNAGLTMIRTNTNATWNMYNTYRLEMTLTVLDLIAIFPNYDPEKYPIGVKSELTREVYTNVNSDTFRTITELENGLTRNPTLFTWINQGRFYTRNSRDILDPYDIFSFTGNQMAFTHTNDDRNIIWGAVHGHIISQDTSKVFPFYRNKPIDKVEIVRHREYSDIIYEMIFFSNSSEVFRYSSNSTIENNYKRTDSYMIPKQTWKNKEYGHTLSYIKTDNYIFSVVRERRRVAFSWTHTSVDFQNTIDLDNITQIHALKALKVSSDSKIVKGPGHTGGDLVILKDSMDFRVRFLKNVSRQYQVRIRYATNAPKTTVFLTGIDTISVELPSTTSRQNPNATDLTYADFGYVTFPRTVPNKTFEGEDTLLMTLYGTPNHSYNIYIDKIEFIPITQSVLDYTEKQNIEKTQKIVNDLFVN
ncbi:pesticidal protein [Bacillus sp. L_1B0_8]|uniref:insecticidal delta-endotoxin Cry8Ea1 family protein n=1 Tax=unclassified Bacillus (in: firmicutes) TaxID=185979 RepID=UPI0005B6FC2C|nr:MULTISPECIES: insecticidal delta-endotoxin Cry8Ea1 family protein [unclassified Bacillus (in: firmicutes)]KIQ76837.1 pesticidal protein [Bacillus sp. L_1B0_5]KIQ80415.1 pesticidal protein [Bacillus sp. L_1B0_8]